MSPNLKKSFHYCIIIYIGVLLSTFEENKKKDIFLISVYCQVFYILTFFCLAMFVQHIFVFYVYICTFFHVVSDYYILECVNMAPLSPHGRSCHENYKRYELRHHPNKHINKNG